MKAVFLIDNLKFSGGRKSFLEFAVDLQKKGHEVELLTLSQKGDLCGIFPSRQISEFNAGTIPDCDFIVTTTPAEAKAAFESKKGETIHLCQGFEIEDLQSRMEDKVLPLRYRGSGLYHKLQVMMKKRQWKSKIAQLDKIYSLGTILVVISKHLKKVLEKRYSKQVYFCGYGVKKEFFYYDKAWSPRRFTRELPCRIISVGPVGVTFKGIPDTLDAISKLKDKKLPIHFIRVSPDEKKDEDLGSSIIDEYHSRLSQEELGELMRNCDIYISNSLEGEGFGLPAMEAMSCGLLCVLSSISSYLNFSDSRDYAIFVPERNPGKTAEAVEKILSMPPEEMVSLRSRSLEVAEEFSLQKALDKLEGILLEKLGRSP